MLKPPPALHRRIELTLADISATKTPDGSTIPTTQEDPDFASGRELVPKLPCFRAVSLLIRLHPEDMISDRLGVHPLGKHIGDGAAPGTVHPGYGNQDGKFVPRTMTAL